jgi:hypothetical protein
MTELAKVSDNLLLNMLVSHLWVTNPSQIKQQDIVIIIDNIPSGSLSGVLWCFKTLPLFSF